MTALGSVPNPLGIESVKGVDRIVEPFFFTLLLLAASSMFVRLRGATEVRDLHDGLSPQLSGQALTIDAIRSLLKRDPAAEELLVDLKAQTRGAADIRRLVYALRSPALDSLGLVGALRKRAAQCEQDSSLRASVEVACYRIAEEALTNVVRRTEVCISSLSLAIDEGALRLEVRDDGWGLPEAQAGEPRRAGVGLTSMRERATELGGRLVVEVLPEGGTCVCAELPLPEED